MSQSCGLNICPFYLPLCSLRRQLCPHSLMTALPSGALPATTPRNGDGPSKCLKQVKRSEANEETGSTLMPVRRIPPNQLPCVNTQRYPASVIPRKQSALLQCVIWEHVRNAKSHYHNQDLLNQQLLQ